MLAAMRRAQFRRRHRRHQDRAGPGRAVRAHRSSVERPTPTLDRRDRAGDRRRLADVGRARRAVRDSIAAGAWALFSASFFALAAIAFAPRCSSVADAVVRDAPRASCSSLGLAIQTAILFVYLGAVRPTAVAAILAAWRPSLFAGFMGAFASQLWFIAFALSDAARVRTLALVEVLFAQIVSLRLFKEPPIAQRTLGIAMIVAAAVVLING